MTHGNPERPADLPQEQRKLVGSLLRDFRNSYKHSQGNPRMQHLLFMPLQDHYTGPNSPGPEQISWALSIVSSHIGQLALPRQHRQVMPDSAAADFREMLTEYGNYLTQPEYIADSENARYIDGVKIRPYPQDRTLRLGFLIEGMIDQDVLYLADGGRYADKGRPRSAESGADPYESYLRTYVLEGTTTHSVAFDALFSEAQDIVSQDPTKLDAHKAMWEECHPHQAYFPPTFLEGMRRG